MTQVEQCRELPEEVWKEILLKLWVNEEDLEHVLICREVCRMWEKLVDEMPPKPYWNPWLKNQYYEFIAVHSSIATIIQSDTDIRNFLSENLEAEKNPFRNHTLSILHSGVEKEEKNLFKIIEDHGEHVWKFLYQPDYVPEALTNFPQMLTHLKNIRTLVLDCDSLSTKQLMAIDGKGFPKDMHKLSELVLYDDDEYEKMSSKLSVNYGSQIKSITLDTLILLSNRSNVLDKFPNLEDLKVLRFITWHVVFEPPPRKQWPKLKRLALSTVYENWGSLPVKNMLRLAAQFADTLQLLSLNFDMNKTVYERNQEDYIDVITTFPTLTQLIIPFSMMCHQGQPTNIPLETHFRFSFPTLKLLVLEDTKDEFKNWDISELGEICTPFWPLVPSSVETISVRIENSNVVLLQDFPVVYKCKRNEAA